MLIKFVANYFILFSVAIYAEDIALRLSAQNINMNSGDWASYSKSSIDARNGRVDAALGTTVDHSLYLAMENFFEQSSFLEDSKNSFLADSKECSNQTIIEPTKLSRKDCANSSQGSVGDQCFNLNAIKARGVYKYVKSTATMSEHLSYNGKHLMQEIDAKLFNDVVAFPLVAANLKNKYLVEFLPNQSSCSSKFRLHIVDKISALAKAAGFISKLYSTNLGVIRMISFKYKNIRYLKFFNLPIKNDANKGIVPDFTGDAWPMMESINFDTCNQLVPNDLINVLGDPKYINIVKNDIGCDD